MARGAALADDVGAWVAAIRRDDIACLIYTSGTGGVPKGVMTTHANIFANCLRRISLAGDDRPRRRRLPLLPAAVAFLRAHRRDDVPDLARRRDLFRRGRRDAGGQYAEARPTIMTAVPRLYETMHQRILRGMERAERAQPAPLRAGAAARPQAARRSQEPHAGRSPARSHRRDPGAAQGAPALRRPAQGDGFGRRAARIRKSAASSSRSACGCCRATARPRPRR